MQPGLDVVVTNYRTPDDLGDFLDSLDKFAPTVEHTVYVVNVEPFDGDREVARDWLALHPQAVEVEFDTNVGYARACNRAASMGSRRVIALFNADVVLTEGALDECYNALLKHPLWGVLGPRQVDQQGRITAGGTLGTNTRPVLRGWLEDGQDGRYSDVRTDCVQVCGSALFIRRTLWDELAECEIFRQLDPDSEGAMPGRLQLFYEDAWLGVHAHSHGWKNVFLGTTGLVHKWHQAIVKNNKQSLETAVFRESRATFWELCDAHGIVHER